MKVFNNQGQTLVEVVLGLAVASLVLLALTRVVTISLKSAQFSKNQTLATHHAQEAMETIRAYRDQNSWSHFLNNCGNESALGLNDPANFELEVDCIPNSDKAEIKVTIYWNSQTHKTELTSYFTQWQ